MQLIQQAELNLARIKQVAKSVRTDQYGQEFRRTASRIDNIMWLEDGFEGLSPGYLFFLL